MARRQNTLAEIRKAAALGGLARARNLSPIELQRIARLGAAATYIRYGSDHYRRAVQVRWERNREREARKREAQN